MARLCPPNKDVDSGGPNEVQIVEIPIYLIWYRTKPFLTPSFGWRNPLSRSLVQQPPTSQSNHNCIQVWRAE